MGIVVCGSNGTGKALGDVVQKWFHALNCPVLRVDGTKTIDENTALIPEQLTTNWEKTL